MKNLIAYRSPDKWKNILTFFIGLTFMLTWLPFIRSIFDGSSYEWGIDYFGFQFYGAGVTASFTFLVFQMAIYAALI